MTVDGVLDKATHTLGKPQYHIRLQPGDVGDYVLLPGDPDRVLRIGRHLENARELVFHREYRTVTGTYKGLRIGATSTGIGCPSTAIAVEELANIGVRGVVRVGSTAALQPHLHIGDLVITTATMKNEGTTSFYVPAGFPAAANHLLTQAVYEAALDQLSQHQSQVYLGVSVCDDAFYGETPEYIRKVSSYKILNVEMEGSAVFTIAHLRGMAAAMVCAVSGNLVTGDVVYVGENQRLIRGWEDAIDVALEGIYRYHQATQHALQAA